MCTSALAHINYCLALQKYQKEQQPSQIDKTILEIAPSKMEQPGERDVKGFYKDWDRLSKVLTYDSQSIYSRYKAQFDEIHQLGNDQQDVISAQREEEDKEIPDITTLTNLQSAYDLIEEIVDQKNADLKAVAETDFNDFLTSRLGEERKGLKDEIYWRFSQKALTLFYGLVDVESSKKYKGLFRNGTPTDTIALDIPLDPKKPVQITTTSENSYDRFYPLGTSNVRTIDPFKLRGHTFYTIGLDGATTGRVEYTLQRSKPLTAKAHL